ncbi:MAG: CdaR family protein [Clostridiaceae bacterium]
MGEKNHKREQIIIQAICLILSFTLWLYISNVESPVRTYTLDKVPVEILNADVLKNSGLVLEPDQKVYVDLKLEGPSSDVYSVKREQFKITADLQSYALKKGENSIPVEIVDYPSNVNIKNDGFLRVTITVDEYITKTVPVKSDLNITAKQGYYYAEPKLSETTAVVSGPSKLIGSVVKVAAKGEYLNLDSDYVGKAGLSPVDSNNNTLANVDVSPAYVDVSIIVRQLKPVKIKVITTGSLQGDYSIKSITPESEYVELKGESSVVEKISSIETEAVDLSKITGTTDVTVKLKFPDGVTSSTGEINVKVEIEKNISKAMIVPVTVKLLADGLKSSLNKNEVNVTVKGLESSINKLTADMLKAELDLSDLKEGVYELTPKVTVENLSDVNVADVNKVTVTITKG